MENTVLQIDVEQIIKSKTHKKIPRFLIRYLEKVIHQKDINCFLRSDAGRQQGYPFFQAVLDLVNVSATISNLESLDKNKRYIFASNHPLGAVEAMAIGKFLGAYFDENINFVVNDILAHLKPLAPFFTSVNVVSSKQERNVLADIDTLFASDKQIIIFPAGACSRRIDGKVQDYEWRKMFIAKARQYQRDVVPMFITGQNSNFFLNLSKIRNILGIKLNIELLYLPDEMFKQHGEVLHITVGQPIDWQTFNTNYSDMQWAQIVRKKVYEIGAAAGQF